MSIWGEGGNEEVIDNELQLDGGTKKDEKKDKKNIKHTTIFRLVKNIIKYLFLY